MKVLVFGLGSMGRRRIRCLQELGISDITGYDIKHERISAAKELGCQVVSSYDEKDLKQFDAFFICTPPDHHIQYLKLALEFYTPAFVEASVLLKDLEEINQESKKRNVLIAPSCTMLFHDAIKKIKDIVISKQYGEMSNFSYHCGQYLPDWHPYEAVQDYYVSNPQTGGCREIVPFELTWLTACFGQPTQVKGCLDKTMDVGADIIDTYAVALKFKQGLGTLLVDVTSRYAIRQLTLNFELAQVQWRWDNNSISVYEVKESKWKEIKLYQHGKEEGYNPNIHLSMYLNEVTAFVNSVKQKKPFINTLDNDIRILQLLNTIEQGDLHV